MSAGTTRSDHLSLSQQAAPSRFTALLWGLLGLCIWSGSFVLTRFEVKSSLTAYDIIALRFSTGGLLLLPVHLQLQASPLKAGSLTGIWHF